jgi:cytoskeleton protein RodZ
MTNFGNSLKKARESKGISLDRIASDTRISTRFLAAIENEEFHLLPGGIFNRGFVRAYAEKVGLDPDQAVADYERSADINPPSDISTASAAGPSSKGRRLYPVALAALALVIVIFYAVNRESGRVAQSAPVPPAVQPAPAPSPPPPVPTVPPETTAAAPEAFTVEMEAKEKTWIKIVADGATVNSGEVLEPGMTRKFTAQDSIDLSIGNAGGVQVKINDMPGKPLGSRGQVRTLTITSATIKDFIG